MTARKIDWDFARQPKPARAAPVASRCSVPGCETLALYSLRPPGWAGLREAPRMVCAEHREDRA